MTISIDDRVGAIEIATHITAPKELVHLSYGDFAFMGEGEKAPQSIGVERKVLQDLVNSITSGRFSGHQLLGLINAYDYTYLLIEGVHKVGADGIIRIPWKRSQGGAWGPLTAGSRVISAKFIDKFCNTLAVFFGIFTKFTDNRKQSGQWITNMYDWWQKPWEKHRSHLQFHIKPPPRSVMTLERPNLVHRILKEIDGVGWDRALEISKHYKNLLDVTTSSVVQLKEVDGIGPKLADRILKSLRGEEL